MVEMSKVWDRTAAFASAALGAVLPIALVLLFVPVSIQLAVTPLLAKQAVAARVIVMFVFWAIELLGALALIALVLGGAIRASEAVRAALARLGPAIAIFILIGVVVGIVASPIGIVMANAGVDMAQLQAGNRAGIGALTAGGAWFMLLYGLVLLIVGVWITARLLVLEPVIVAERRGVGAIAQAFRMTRGLALKIVGVLILYWIVATVAVWAARAVFGSVFSLIAPGDGDISLAVVLTSVVVAAVAAAFKTVAAIFVAKLYQAIVDTREATLDLA